MEQDKQEQQAAAISLGTQLRTGREARGLSMGEVADRLKLSLKQLAAIEDGDFSRLPGAPFARGFVRSYARFLELDDDSVLARLDACVPLNRPQARAEAVPLPAAAPRSLALPASLGLLLLLGAAWLLWPHQTVPVLAPHGAQPLASAPGMDMASAPAAVAASTPVVAAPVAAGASAPLAAVGMKTIEISTKAAAWVSIVDSSGKKLLFEVLPAGSSKQVQGQAPFRLKVGNAAQVSLSYNGQAVDMSGKIRGTTAKLELN